MQKLFVFMKSMEGKSRRRFRWNNQGTISDELKPKTFSNMVSFLASCACNNLSIFEETQSALQWQFYATYRPGK